VQLPVADYARWQILLPRTWFVCVAFTPFAHAVPVCIYRWLVDARYTTTFCVPDVRTRSSHPVDVYDSTLTIYLVGLPPTTAFAFTLFLTGSPALFVPVCSRLRVAMPTLICVAFVRHASLRLLFGLTTPRLRGCHALRIPFPVGLRLFGSFVALTAHCCS